MRLAPKRDRRSLMASTRLLVGYFVTRLQERLPLSAYRRPLLGTGFCGAFTTFSTMQVELLRMLDAHRYGLAVGYAAASLGLGYVMAEDGPQRGGLRLARHRF